MKKLLCRWTIMLFLLGAWNAQAQTEIKSIQVKKGQVLDALYITTKKDVGDQLNEYFKTVFPIAEEAGYHRLPSMKIVGSPTQGNYQPSALVFGYWDDLQSREDFLEAIVKVVPDFHQTRRDIWSSFSLAYYELEEDLSFEIDPSKVYVATNYWSEDADDFVQFKRDWLSKAKRLGGQVVLEQVDAQSPYGYLYDPDYFTIMSWSSKAAFEQFYKEDLRMDHSAVKHVNQFIVQ